jgi:hypothetical protein
LFAIFPPKFKSRAPVSSLLPIFNFNFNFSS